MLSVANGCVGLINLHSLLNFILHQLSLQAARGADAGQLQLLDEYAAASPAELRLHTLTAGEGAATSASPGTPLVCCAALTAPDS